MKAVRIHQFGGPEVLTYEDLPDPKPRKDQVLIRVRACALNHLDLFVRNGLPGVNLPHILGSDIAGGVSTHAVSEKEKTALCISPKTANTHVCAIMTKLGVHNRTQAAAHAYKQAESHR